MHSLKQGLFSSAVEQLIRNEQVVGSNPMRGSKCAWRILQRVKVKDALSLTFILFLICSCTNAPAPRAAAQLLYDPQYAKGFYLEQEGADKILHIHNPWQGAEGVEYTYRLVDRDSPEDALSSMTTIPVPLKRVICLSTTHLAYIEALSQTATVVGVSGIGYVSNPEIHAAFKQGGVKDVGYEAAISYETVALLRPDVVFAYGVAGEMSAVADKLNSMGIRVVFLGDYLENNPLGKAEYLRLMAAFYNMEEKADTLFRTIIDDYETAKGLVRDIQYRPKVMMNAPWRNAWYIPGADNYLAELVRDAGGTLLGARQGMVDSAPVSLEKAYTYAMTADYWLHPNAARSLVDLRNMDSRFAATPAYRQHRVFNNSFRRTPGGGSDFWESGVVRPHIILRDLIGIFHPDLLPGYRLVYYERLED